MNANPSFARSVSGWKTGLSLVLGLSALSLALPLLGAEHGGAPRAAAS